MSSSKIKKMAKNCLVMIISLCLAGVLFAGVVHSKSSDEGKKDKFEVLYYDKSSGVKIINKNGFLLRVEKNDKGLRIVHELGPYPDAYPEDLPEPKTHVEKQVSSD
ncbi:MAG: hypothetical protein ACOCZ2_03310 [Thermodesulfobacteriota bacterium]